MTSRVTLPDIMLNPPIGPAFTYRGVIVSIYDGDSMTVDLDLGLGIWKKNQKLRLYGVDTPELRGPERPYGLDVRDKVHAACPPASRVLVRTLKDKTGKFGRWLAIIWTPSLSVSLNAWIIREGLGDPYFGGKRG